MAGMKEWECKAERALGCIEGVAVGVSELVRDVILGAVEEVDDALKQYREELENLREDVKAQSKFLEVLLQQKDAALTENERLRGMIKELTEENERLLAKDRNVEIATSASGLLAMTDGERIATAASGLAMTDAGKIATSAAKLCNDEADCEGCGWVST